MSVDSVGVQLNWSQLKEKSCQGRSRSRSQNNARKLLFNVNSKYSKGIHELRSGSQGSIPTRLYEQLLIHSFPRKSRTLQSTNLRHSSRVKRLETVNCLLSFELRELSLLQEPHLSYHNVRRWTDF